MLRDFSAQLVGLLVQQLYLRFLQESDEVSNVPSLSTIFEVEIGRMYFHPSDCQKSELFFSVCRELQSVQCFVINHNQNSFPLNRIITSKKSLNLHNEK